MQITPDSAVYQEISAAMGKVVSVSGGSEALRKMYCNRTQNRLVWDVFWAADSTYLNDLHNMVCNDDYIETMLFRICKQLGLIQKRQDEQDIMNISHLQQFVSE